MNVAELSECDMAAAEDHGHRGHYEGWRLEMKTLSGNGEMTVTGVVPVTSVFLCFVLVIFCCLVLGYGSTRAAQAFEDDKARDAEVRGIDRIPPPGEKSEFMEFWRGDAAGPVYQRLSDGKLLYPGDPNYPGPAPEERKKKKAEKRETTAEDLIEIWLGDSTGPVYERASDGKRLYPGDPDYPRDRAEDAKTKKQAGKEPEKPSQIKTETGSETGPRREPLPQGLPGSFSEASGLEVETEPVDYPTGSEDATVRKVPGLKKFPRPKVQRQGEK